MTGNKNSTPRRPDFSLVIYRKQIHVDAATAYLLDLYPQDVHGCDDDGPNIFDRPSYEEAALNEYKLKRGQEIATILLNNFGYMTTWEKIIPFVTNTIQLSIPQRLLEAWNRKQKGETVDIDASVIKARNTILVAIAKKVYDEADSDKRPKSASDLAIQVSKDSRFTDSTKALKTIWGSISDRTLLDVVSKADVCKSRAGRPSKRSNNLQNKPS